MLRNLTLCLNTMTRYITVIVISRKSRFVLLICHNALIIDSKPKFLALSISFPSNSLSILVFRKTSINFIAFKIQIIMIFWNTFTVTFIFFDLILNKVALSSKPHTSCANKFRLKSARCSVAIFVCCEPVFLVYLICLPHLSLEILI